jgi:hypothetical protein
MSQTKAQLIDGKGSAAFDGDLTVDTNTLYVDSTNNRVGIGTTSPGTILDARGIVSIGSANNSNALIQKSAVPVGSFNLTITSGGGLTSESATTPTDALAGSVIKLLGGDPTTDPFGGGIQYYANGSTSPNGAGVGNQHVFYTRSAANTYTERLRIDAAGRVGIGSTAAAYKLTVKDAADQIHITNATAGDTAGDGFTIGLTGTDAQLIQRENGPIIFYQNSGEAFRVDTSKRLLVGTSSMATASRAVFQGRSDNAAIGPDVYFQRGQTNPASGSTLARLIFADNASSPAAYIQVDADGTWGSGDYPGRLVFSTTADGASSPTERMRITSGGDVGFASGITLGSVTPTAGGFYSTAGILGTGAGTNAVKFSTTTGKITYDTSSRLNKIDIEDCPYGIAEVKQLLPRRYYRTDDERLEVGFVADEVASILPEFVPFGPRSAVTGNEEDTEVIPVNVNYDKLTAVLTKALQEAVERIETLEAEVTALKAS